ncbi:MAG: cysteine--tRNA ligase, partial [Oscillospiraceae bacterium]|nr:cysteine--tRNA ligase [Oscillospiraceae bacterium]
TPRTQNDLVRWVTRSQVEDQALNWASPWGVGYPGWHIACTGLCLKHLGEDLDLHCGGIDNACPPHTNEIAQSEAYLGHPWCNFWFHVHHLNTNSGKMSKSKGEFLTVSLLEEKGYDPLVYRLFCLQSHYRRALVFSFENLDNAAAAYQKLIARVAALDPGDSSPVDRAAFDALREKFSAALGSDLNTSLAVTAVYDVLKAKTNDAAKLALLAEFDQVLGLDLLEKAAAKRAQAAAVQTSNAGGYTIRGEGDAAVDALVRQRAEAKKAKNFREADRIREELKARGIEITDVPGGAQWRRV